VALVVGLSGSLSGSSPRFFQAATQADFLKADLNNLSIDSRGQLLLGPATDLVYETAAPFLWAMLPAADGSLFVGTGNEGRVFKIDPQGKGAAFFDASELEAHALAPAPGGGLYVGTSPDGKIYKVSNTGASSVFFEPGEKYIWALASDRQGRLYAATGEKGIVYRIEPDGKGARFYQAKAMHVTAMAVDASGQLLIGTESPGRVLRVDPQGKAFVLLDSPFQEIKALRFDEKGMLYVAAISAPTGGTSPAQAPPAGGPDRPTGDTNAQPVATVTAEITSVAVVDTTTTAVTTGQPAADRRSARGAVYRIAPDGLWDQLWESREDAPYDLLLDGDGRLVVGTGSKGKIYRLEGNPLRPTLLARAGAQQVTSLHKDARGRIYYATANPGKVYRLSSDRAPEGTAESEPLDAQMVSTWGAISWRGTTPAGSRIQLFTRSGNTETPDDTWSAWSAPYTVSQGSSIVSPKARFLQWRAVLSGKTETPLLTSISAAYLPRNMRPEVRSITVHPPGIVFQKPFSTGDPDLAGFENQTTPERALTQAAMTAQGGGNAPALGRRTYQKGLQTLIWRADDQNGDELSFDVQYRREGDAAWKTLRADVTEAILVWDTATLPNGTYFVKVVASDAPSNAPDSAMSGELDSVAFEVDNQPPTIGSITARAVGGRVAIAFEVRDDHSPVQRAEYSEDGQLWRAVFPRDGIADSRQEQYELNIDGALGPRGLSLRATDAMNNVGTAQVEAAK
jgi:hypothetical protein